MACRAAAGGPRAAIGPTRRRARAKLVNRLLRNSETTVGFQFYVDRFRSCLSLLISARLDWKTRRGLRYRNGTAPGEIGADRFSRGPSDIHINISHRYVESLINKFNQAIERPATGNSHRFISTLKYRYYFLDCQAVYHRASRMRYL